jgi:general secretion pathway protein I
MKTNAHRAARGFTLIEVLVALLILSVALAGIAVTMGRMLSNAQLMQDRTYASWIAQNRIVQIRAEGTLPGPGRESGDVEFANGTWDWRSVISETGIENLLRVDVSVSRAGSDDTIKTVTGFIGVPAMPNGANRLWAAAAQGGGGGPQGPGAPGTPDTPGTPPDGGGDVGDGSHQ